MNQLTKQSSGQLPVQLSVQLSPRRHFVSDNNSGVIPEVLETLTQINQGHLHAYGADPVTEYAVELFRKNFGKDAEIFFVFNGTAANILALQSLLKSYESIICSHCAHIQVDECGAPEKWMGCKLQSVFCEDGKLNIEKIKSQLIRLGDQHFSQPKVISLTQPTELGTVYSLNEISEICQFAKKNKLLVHMDGSRLVNAAIYLGCTFEQMTADLGVDVVSFGGTKNGLLGAEAIIFLNKDLAQNFRFARKQAMQLAGKMRFISAQFIAFFENQTGFRYAKHSLAMTKLLESQLREKTPQILITQAVQSNAVFPKLPKHVVSPLREKYFFYIWNEKEWIARLMCSFDTTAEDVTEFVDNLFGLL